MNEKSNERQTAIVTGASSGIGLGLTLALLGRGYRVVATARTISKSKNLKASEDLVLVDGDISKKETAIKVTDAALKRFTRVDLLVNNAGIYVPKPFTESMEEPMPAPSGNKTVEGSPSVRPWRTGENC